MLIKGECEGLGALAAASKHGLTRQRYYQVLKQFEKGGALALLMQKRGPKANSVRTNEVEELAGGFPRRWHVEEFFNAHQELGWKRAGTCNLNIRYGQMTMALIAQAAIDRLRKRLAPPAANWDAKHMALAYFAGLEGDLRVEGNTIGSRAEIGDPRRVACPRPRGHGPAARALPAHEDVGMPPRDPNTFHQSGPMSHTIIVTYYNAPDADRLHEHYEGLPAKLREEKVDPRVPWLYGFELDFRFR